MEIIKGIEIQDLSLFFKKEKILVLGDLHIGQEASMQRDGVLIPRFQHKDLMNKTKKILLQTKPKLIILNGDIKHEFAGISREEWKHTLDYFDLLQKHSKVIIVKGNHDKIIEPIALKKGIDVVDYYSINPDTIILHGDIIPGEEINKKNINIDKKNKNKKTQKNSSLREISIDYPTQSFSNIDEVTDAYNKSKIVIIGHEHPAIGLRDGNRVEKYKCFLKGKYKEHNSKGKLKEKILIVMPSMNQLTEGTDILSEKLLSPFLNESTLENFEVWIIENEIFYFGKVKGLKRA